ncbi:MAG: UdgX family uracil-DNA binding protein [Verrucomicrobiota bacterium]
MKCVDPGKNFASWRDAARSLLESDIPPHEVLWETAEGLFSSSAVTEDPLPSSRLKVPGAFVELAESVACHRDPSRWALLYQILWRIVRGGERHLLAIASDADMAKARMLEKNVRREIHKMHAFVRFKLIDTDATTGRERYAAWFEPDHFIVEAGTPFFRKRFANMDWSIFTPKGCAHWNGEALTFTPGIPNNPVDNPDALEAAWRVYYRSIFNPARLKVKAMQTEMPKRYWKNLPEADLIEELVENSKQRVNSMYSETLRPEKPAPQNAYLANLKDLSVVKPCNYPPDPKLSLTELRELSATCRACPLWKNATGSVFGEGPANARIMVVGEQPGDREDVAGKPFVGPAGKLLDEALVEAGLDRSAMYLTNAVKHFKWTPRGKHRLHQKPDAGEIDACRPWVLAELKQIAPKVLILLGATAARSMLGKPLPVTRHRGLIDAPQLASRVILTVHPSYLLRLPDPAAKAAEFARFVADLKLAQAG